MSKQTSVEWLQEQLDQYITQAQKEQTKHLFDIAHHMTEDQILDAYFQGGQDMKEVKYQGMHRFFEKNYKHENEKTKLQK